MFASLLVLLVRALEKYPIFLISCCAVLPYFRCLFYSEWYIDELFAIVRNEDAKNESSWYGVFSHDFWGNPLWAKGGWTHKSYRPLTVLSYCLEFFVIGDIKPQPLRAFSICLHWFNSLMLYFVAWKFYAVKARDVVRSLKDLRQLTTASGDITQSKADTKLLEVIEPFECRPRAGLKKFLLWDNIPVQMPNAWSVTLACCLFAAHPVHVENVVYLVGRADMMATGIWCLVFYVYLESNSLALFPLHAFLCIVAGLCKESGFMVIPFLVTVEVTRPRKSILIGMLFLAMFLCIFGLRSYVTGGTSAGFSFVDTPVQYSGSLLTRTLTYMYQHAFYWKLIIMPWHLSWDYSYDTIPLLKSHFDDYRTLLIAAVYLHVVSLVAYFSQQLSGKGNSRRKSHMGLVGLFWVIVPFLPASNLFFVVGVTVGERLLYCSTCGLVFFVPAIINYLFSVETQIDLPNRKETSLSGKYNLLEDRYASELSSLKLRLASNNLLEGGIPSAALDAKLASDVKSDGGSSSTSSSSSGAKARKRSRSRGKSPKGGKAAAFAELSEENLRNRNATALAEQQEQAKTLPRGTLGGPLALLGSTSLDGTTVSVAIDLCTALRGGKSSSPAVLNAEDENAEGSRGREDREDSTPTASRSRSAKLEDDIIDNLGRGTSFLLGSIFVACLGWLTIFVVNCTLRVGHWQNREVLFEVDTAAWPRSLKSHHQLGTVYHRENRWEEALHHYNMSLSLHDDNALTDYCIAQIYIETSRFELAIPRFEKIMQGHGIGFAGYNTFALFADYGFTLVILKRYEEAVNALEHGLKINADLPHAWNALGVAFGHMDMLQESQDAFANGLKWEADQPFLWNNLAAIWMRAGAFEQAQMGVMKALEAEPENPVFLFNMQLLQFIANGQPEVLNEHKPRMEMFYNRMN
ncbi:unnamed protein product [Amoebophrya sp. A25]|nr:unnamed protein product [Amoebophrya sp. A25]|eukprot:GSA25T00017612001.1